MAIRSGGSMPKFRFHFIRIPRWQLMLGASLVLALIVAFFVLALGIFLLLLPALMIAGAVAVLFGSPQPPVDRGAANDRVIDGEYRVLERDRLDRRDR
jgi:hypothetical protein